MRKRDIFVLSIGLVLLFSSCGKKGDPLPKGLQLPEKIQDLTGEVKDGLLFLSFSLPGYGKEGAPINDIAGFKVVKGCGTCMGVFEPFKEIRFDEERGYARSNGKIYIYDNDLVEGQEYSYKVYPFTKKGTRGDASNLFTIIWQRPPETPAGISVREDDGKVELLWEKETDAYYNIYRFDDNRYPLFPLNTMLIQNQSYVDTGLENGKTYIYEVRKVKVKNGIPWEGEGLRIEATPRDKTPPATVANVQAEKKGNQILITWTENIEPDVAGYNIYMIRGNEVIRLNKEPVQGKSFVDTHLHTERYVSYYLTCVDTSGNEGAPSRESIVILKE